MKKVFLLLILIIFFERAISPIWGKEFWQETFEASDSFEEKEEMIIFSDPNYNQPTHNFSPGQKVYIKIKNPMAGDKERTLRLLDSKKREIKKLTLNREGGFFFLSFSAPETPGVYYIDIKIEDSGRSKFASQENINVGKVNNTEVESKVESVVNSGEKTILPVNKATVIPSLTIKPIPSIEEKQIVIFGIKIRDFFRKMLSFLTKLGK